MTGLVSVTFRQLRAEQIIRLAARAGLDGIEWGEDVHVPPGDIENAARIGKMTRKAGLEALSYGSYYRLGEQDDIREAFTPVLETAKALGTPHIRRWAGKKPPGQADDDYFLRAATDWNSVCEMAGDIVVSTEYHRGTLTETAGSTIRLLKLTEGRANRATYWQPNPDISPEENLAELKALEPFVSSLHVFHWRGDGERRPLAEGEAEWLRYLKAASGKGYFLEFVTDDSPDAFIADAKTLKRWLKRI
jgi:sugar phosphate isomerase/epimerase